MREKAIIFESDWRTDLGLDEDQFGLRIGAEGESDRYFFDFDIEGGLRVLEGFQSPSTDYLRGEWCDVEVTSDGIVAYVGPVAAQENLLEADGIETIESGGDTRYLISVPTGMRNEELAYIQRSFEEWYRDPDKKFAVVRTDEVKLFKLNGRTKVAKRFTSGRID